MENSEISMLSFFLLFWLHKQFLQASWIDVHKLGRLGGAWQALREMGPCRARWMVLTVHPNRAARIQTFAINMYMNLKAV